MMTYYQDFKYEGNLNDANPYRFLDGNWGGLIAPQIWFRGVDKENPSNVFELSERLDKENKTIKRHYHRVWDNEKEIWRHLTEEEKVKFVLSDREYYEFKFDKIVIPMFTKKIEFPSISEIFKEQPMK
jgi:hypothetical protein